MMDLLNIPKASKGAIEKAEAEVASLITSGNEDVLSFYIRLSAIEQLVKKLKSNKLIKDELIYELEKLNKEERQVRGCKLDIVEAGVKYDFSNTPKWLELQGRIDELRDGQKHIETLAKTARNSTNYVDENGEEIIVFPAQKTSITTVKVIIPKD